MERLRITRLSCNRFVLISFCFDRCKGGIAQCAPPLPLSAGGGGGGGGGTPSQFFKKEGEAGQDLSFQRRVAGKEGGDFFQGGLQFLDKK